MALLGWILNLALGGSSIEGAEPPTAQPLRVQLADGINDNGIILGRTANTTDPAHSQNSVETT